MDDTDGTTPIPGFDVQELRYLGAILAVIVAGIHILHPQLGGPRLLLHLQAGTLFDPRPLAFVLSGFLIVFGILLVYNGLFVRQIYLAGIGLMLVFLLGYVAWHTALDHGGFWPHIPAHGHDDIGVIEAVWLHLSSDATAAVSKLHELALLVVLAVLYRYDRPESAP